MREEFSAILRVRGAQESPRFAVLRQLDKTHPDATEVNGGRGLLKARSYFSREAKYRPQTGAVIQCIIYGTSPAVWFNLSDNHSDNGDPSTFIPLSPELAERLKQIRKDVAFGRLPVQREPPEAWLKVDFLIKQASLHFHLWRATDAYACANLAHWVTSTFFSSIEERVETICSALRYARHSFNPDILSRLVEDRLLPLLRKGGSLPFKCKHAILNEIISLYGWTGNSAKALSGGLPIYKILSQEEMGTDLPEEYSAAGRIKRRMAQQILVCSPEHELGRRLLDEAASMARHTNELADIDSTKATIAIVHNDPLNLQRYVQNLQESAAMRERYFSSNSAGPVPMTLNNFIAELWYSCLISVRLSDQRGASESIEKLGIVLGGSSSNGQFLSPPPFPGAWTSLLKRSKNSAAKDAAFGLYKRFGQPRPSPQLIAFLDNCIVLLCEAV